VEVRCEGGSTRITQQRRGDTTDVMLDYVGYALATCARPMPGAWPRPTCPPNMRRNCPRRWKPA